MLSEASMLAWLETVQLPKARGVGEAYNARIMAFLRAEPKKNGGGRVANTMLCERARPRLVWHFHTKIHGVYRRLFGSARFRHASRVIS